MAPMLTRIADVTILVGQPITVGETPDGLRRVVPILGGRMSGPRLQGAVLPAGADYQLIRSDGYTKLDARYLVRLDDGAMIYIVNTGVRFGPPDIMARIVRGEPVDPAQVYFRTTPRFETASPCPANGSPARCFWPREHATPTASRSRSLKWVSRCVRLAASNRPRTYRTPAVNPGSTG